MAKIDEKIIAIFNKYKCETIQLGGFVFEESFKEIAQELIDKQDELFSIQRVNHRRGLLPKNLTHIDGHKPNCECKPCKLVKSIFGNCC